MDGIAWTCCALHMLGEYVYLFVEPLGMSHQTRFSFRMTKIFIKHVNANENE